MTFTTPVAHTSGIEIHLRIRIHPGSCEKLVAFLRDAIPFYEQPGDIRVRLLADTHDPERFIEIIEYATQDAHDTDQLRVKNEPEMHAYLERWRALLAEPPVVEIYTHQSMNRPTNGTTDR